MNVDLVWLLALQAITEWNAWAQFWSFDGCLTHGSTETAELIWSRLALNKSAANWCVCHERSTVVVTHHCVYITALHDVNCLSVHTAQQ